MSDTGRKVVLGKDKRKSEQRVTGPVAKALRFPSSSSVLLYVHRDRTDY